MFHVFILAGFFFLAISCVIAEILAPLVVICKGIGLLELETVSGTLSNRTVFLCIPIYEGSIPKVSKLRIVKKAVVNAFKLTTYLSWKRIGYHPHKDLLWWFLLKELLWRYNSGCNADEVFKPPR